MKTTPNPSSSGADSNGITKSSVVRYLLDSSALYALLVQEPGSEAVVNAIQTGAVIAQPNYAEVLTLLVDKLMMVNKKTDIDPWLEMIDGMGIDVINCDAQDAMLAAKLRDPGRALGLSLGDRLALAVALRYNLIALTGDRNWKKLHVAGLMVEVFR